MIQQSECLPNISDHAGFLPRAESSRAVIAKETETTVPSEERMEVPRTHAGGPTKQEDLEAAGGSAAAAGRAQSLLGGTCALGAGATSTAAGPRCQ